MQKKLLGVAVAAALVAPGLALAQSSVQVYGTVHLSLNQSKFGADTANAGGGGITKYGVDSHSSNWGLRSTESLGGGMSAWFQAEFNMQMARTTNDNVGIAANGEGSFRNSGVGLRGGFGNVYLGNWETPWAQTFRLWDVGTIGGWGPTTSIIGRRESTNQGTQYVGQSATALTAGQGVTSFTDQAPGGSATAFTGAATNNVGYSLWRRYSNSVFYESPEWSGVQLKLAIQPNSGKSNATGAT
ncbi:MAG TPA: porin, partial [Burkholderiales bacterium]